MSRPRDTAADARGCGPEVLTRPKAARIRRLRFENRDGWGYPVAKLHDGATKVGLGRRRAMIQGHGASRPQKNDKERGKPPMVKFVLSMTRGQKRLVLLVLDLLCVALAFYSAAIIQYSTLRPAAVLIQSWPLVPVLMAVALGVSLLLGTADVRL